MLDYWLRIYRKYECPIQQVVIFLKQTDSPAVYINELAVGNTRHEYRIIRLWEQDPQPLLANPALLPLAVLASTDPPYSSLLEQVAVEIDKIEEPEQQQNITACVEVLAALNFDKQLIRQYFREELMEESPIYQEILEKGAKKGKLQTLTRLLSRRFGTISLQLQQQLQALSINQLDDLSDALFDFSEISDLAVWLQNQQ
jgi:predicted transposase YdaD